MGDTWIDATQSYENETSSSTEITIVSNDDLLAIPATSDANYLIKLVNNASTNINNLYILQANTAGEIRFLTKEAYLNNDVSANEGNQYYNVKIGADGKLYCYYTYNFINNPIKISGWYDIMNDLAGQGFQLTLLEGGFAGFELQLITAQTNITTLFSNVGVLNTEIVGINAEIGALATQNDIFQGLFGEIQRTFYASKSKALIGRFSRTNWKDAVATLRTRFDLRQATGRLGNIMSPARTLTAPQLSAYQMVSSQAGLAINKAVNDVGLTLGIIGGGVVLAGIYKYYSNAEEDTKRDLISDLIETKEDMILQQANTPNSYYTTANRIAEVGLSVNAGTQGNYTGAVGFYEVSLATAPNSSTGGYIVIEIYLVSTVKTARISKVLDSGTRAWVVGNTISIDKQTDLGGWDNAGTRYLLLNVNIVYSPLQAIDLIINSVLAEQPIDDRRNRRRSGVIGVGEYDTATFTTSSATETNTDTNEIITYSTLKSRLNLLPTGSSDVDVYTSTGQVGVGTAPATRLHIYHATDNKMRLETSTTGTNSIEFRRGTANDAFTDFRLISETGLFKLQYENNIVAYGDSGTDLLSSTSTLTTIYKDTTFNGKVSIGNPIHATYKLDVVGDINISTGSLYRVNGSAYKPANAVLADTATDLASGVVLTVAKGGTGASTFTAGGLLIGNTTTAITQNAGLTYTTATSLLTAGNVNVPTGGKYKINGVDLSYNDLTNKLTAGANIAISGTNEISATSGTTYTAGNGISITGSSIALSGNTTGALNILGNVNISTALGTSLYKLNVEGDINVSGIGKKFYQNNSPIVSSPWSPSGTTIEYNGGSVGIGTPALSYKLNVSGTINCTAIYINDIQFTNLFSGNATNIYYAGGTLFGATGTPTSIVEIQKTNSAFGASISMLGTNFDASNGLRISQNWVSAGNIQYDIIHKNSGVDTTAMIIRAGRVGIGTFPATLNKFEVLGKSLFSDNVGIGTVPSTVATTKLDVNGDTRIVGKTTSGGLSISGTTEFLTANPSVPTIPAVLSITPAPTSTFTPSSSTTRCAILTYQGSGTATTYSVVIPAGGMLCDILMVGGGGMGGRDIGAGGGGGAVLYSQNVLIKEGTYSLVVGRGAVSTSGEAKGQSTTGFGATLLGGGSAGDANWAGTTYANDGGSGAGGKGVSDEWSRRAGRPIVGGSKKGGMLCDGTLYEGNVGGYGVQQNNAILSSGGGGAYAVGGNGQTGGYPQPTGVGSSGGAGISNTILDATYYWGGGGGGGSYGYTIASNGGAGGGGAGQNSNGSGATATGSNGASSFFAVGTAINGINGTGGGGGGTGYNTFTAGSGGAGVIIIRYRRPINNNQTIDFLPTNTNATMTMKEGMIGGNYKIQASIGSSIFDAFTIDATTGSLFMANNSFSLKGTNDTLITNNCGIGIDPSSTYKLNVNGDLNINGNIYQNGFLTTNGFQGTFAYNLKFSGNTNFLITTRAKNCNLQMYIGDKYGHYILRDNAVNEWRGSANGGMSINTWSYYSPYITMQGDTPRPFVVWLFNGNETNMLVVENWYN
jgi:hypothetical protein